MADSNQSYLSKGISVLPANFSVGDKIRISYDGLLAKSGAQDITLHIGYGKNWNNTADMKMKKTPTGFESTLSVVSSESLSISFHDGTNNWDNNSGRNYIFDVI